ncbi:hypothetical protein HPB49_008815 [Dermacentor silvarum]|uniref:Uncharacterized protein n=1 Tax=Dermacentor silvarum TaxID=543639 RepID=A0ACB8DXI7_DERSI|nr:hypothetical protein HPB49_008815 [Dermacentor silvarum]
MAQKSSSRQDLVEKIRDTGTISVADVVGFVGQLWDKLPPDVLALFRGFLPSSNHGTRLCKILRSEWLRQAPLYLELLVLRVKGSTNDYTSVAHWRQVSRAMDQHTEHLWQQTLTWLRSCLPKKKVSNAPIVHTLDGVNLPVH